MNTFKCLLMIITTRELNAIKMDTDLVSLWEHCIKLLICERPVPLINFPLPPPCLQLLWSHAHQVTWRKQKRKHSKTIIGLEDQCALYIVLDIHLLYAVPFSL